MHYMEASSYKRLARRLDALPNGFPATNDGAELRLLAYLFTPEEAELAAQLRLTLETAPEIAARIGKEPRALRKQLKGMVRKGLISAGRAEGGLGYAIMPFAVGFYEEQVDRIDGEFAHLFEEYYQQALAPALAISPQLHRVVPVGKSLNGEVEVQPYESVADIVANTKAWGVLDCICRKQKALIGDPCEHPVEVCMTFSEVPGAFDQDSTVRALTQKEALETLHRAAEAGLVHSVSNAQEGTWYVCNCCTCSCAILRGMADLGVANVVARSAFVNQVDEEACVACGLCVESCPFDALSVDDVARVDGVRCVGCGVCTLVCPEEALGLVRRPEDEVLPPPVTEDEWRAERAAARGIELDAVL
jgi:formate hydrogenlyase subunit 6/NADH:ubiquinone oxidoreductase subunit I